MNIEENGVSIVADKKVSFVEALLAKKLGYEIYGKTDCFVKDWNPKGQNMVSWNAIDNGEWYIKSKEQTSQAEGHQSTESAQR